MTETPIRAYFGHHKSGSTMILRIMQKVCNYAGLKHAHFHSPKMWGYQNGAPRLDDAVRKLGLDVVSYISADLSYVGDRQIYRGFHVIRDPRDIVVSSYYSHRYSHPTDGWPELAEFRELLESLPEEEGLLENIKFTARLRVDGLDLNLFDTMHEWDYSMSNVMEIRFEDLVARPYQLFIEMFEFLGLIDETSSIEGAVKSALRHGFRDRYPGATFLRKVQQIPAWLLFSFVYDNRFARLSEGRGQGQEDVRSHYRKGIPGDWRNHFRQQHTDYFKAHYGDLLIKLGYEKDKNWQA